MGLIAARVEAQLIDRPGGIFVRPRRADLGGGPRPAGGGRARDHRRRRGHARRAGRAGARCRTCARRKLVPTREHASRDRRRRPRRRATLILANGLGGFTPDGREYVITTDRRPPTPAPWVNVLANPHFGTRRLGERRRLHLERERPRIPPDAVEQRSGQRRERRGVLPARRGERALLVADAAAGARPDAVRHAARLRLQRLRARRGRHPHASCGSTSRATRRSSSRSLKMRNASGRPRRLSVTGYVEWVLGDLRPKSVMHVVTEVDGKTGALFARNRLQHGVRRPRRVLRRRRRDAHGDRRPHRVHRPQRHRWPRRRR